MTLQSRKVILLAEAKDTIAFRVSSVSQNGKQISYGPALAKQNLGSGPLTPSKLLKQSTTTRHKKIVKKRKTSTDEATMQLPKKTKNTIAGAPMMEPKR
ncbi:hypothetical protein ABZP36_027247 [Zizania latifolia]